MTEKVSANAQFPNDFSLARVGDIGRKIIRAPEAWPIINTNNKVTIATIDTGLHYLHDDIGLDRIVMGWGGIL